MEIISTSNLVPLENEKTTACNFEAMAMHSFVIPHDFMKDQIASYAYLPS